MAKQTKKNTNSAQVWVAVAGARIALGFVFLWAFADKLLGLGMSTPEARAWVNGGSPTTGFLKGVEGPFASFFNGIAGQPWADWLFMLGLLGIGLALVLGIGVRLAAIAGTALLVMMWAASLPLENNPIVDDHLIYAFALWVFAGGLASQRLSIATWWQSLGFVKKNTWLW